VCSLRMPLFFPQGRSAIGDWSLRRRCGGPSFAIRSLEEDDFFFTRADCATSLPSAKSAGVSHNITSKSSVRPLSVSAIEANNGMRDCVTDHRLAHLDRNDETYGKRYVQSMAVAGELQGHHGCVNSIHFNVDGTVLLSGSDDLSLCLYSTRSESHSGWSRIGSVRTLHSANIFDAVFLPTNQETVVSCGFDGRVLLTRLNHSLSDVELLLPLHRSALRRMASRIATSSAWPNSALVSFDSDLAVLVDLRAEVAVGQLSPDSATVRRVNAVCQHPTHPYVVAMATNTPAVYMCDMRCLSSGNSKSSCFLKLWAPSAVNTDGIGGISFSASGEAVVANYKQGDPIVYEWRRTLGTGQCNDREILSGLEGIPTGKKAGAAANQPAVPHVVLRGRKNEVTMFKEAIFILDDEYVCSGGDCGSVFFWHRSTGALVHRIPHVDGSIVNGVLAHDALREIVVCGIDSTTKVLRSNGDLTKCAGTSAASPPHGHGEYNEEEASHINQSSSDEQSESFTDRDDDDQPPVENSAAMAQCAALQLVLIEPLLERLGLSTCSPSCLPSRAPPPATSPSKVELRLLQHALAGLRTVHNETLAALVSSSSGTGTHRGDSTGGVDGTGTGGTNSSTTLAFGISGDGATQRGSVDADESDDETEEELEADDDAGRDDAIFDQPGDDYYEADSLISTSGAAVANTVVVPVPLRSASVGTTNSMVAGGGGGNSPYSAEDVASSAEGGPHNLAMAANDLLNIVEALLKKGLDVMFRSARRFLNRRQHSVIQDRGQIDGDDNDSDDGGDDTDVLPLSLRWDQAAFDIVFRRRRGQPQEAQEPPQIFCRALLLADVIEMLLRDKAGICKPGVEARRFAVASCRLRLRQIYLRMALGPSFLQETLFQLRHLAECRQYHTLVSLGGVENSFGQRSPLLVPLALKFRLLHLAGLEGTVQWLTTLRLLVELLEDHPATGLVARVVTMLQTLGVLQAEGESEEVEEEPPSSSSSTAS
jgi:WD repeat-containing protein 42A